MSNTNTRSKWTKEQGFTIVELLIVIVVIAILAAISIVSYTGIQNKAHNSAVIQDLRSLGQQLTLYRTTEGAWPTTGAQLTGLNLRLTKDSYGNPFTASGSDWNVLYCRAADGTGNMSLIAASKGGKVFKYIDGSVSEYTGRWSDVVTFYPVCEDAGTPMPFGTANRDWFYINTWRWVQ